MMGKINELGPELTLLILFGILALLILVFVCIAFGYELANRRKERKKLKKESQELMKGYTD